jgi:hypothetical protein
LLAGDGDKTEIADGRTHGSLITLNDHSAETLAGGGKRMGEADNAGTDNRDIELQKRPPPEEFRIFIAFRGK